MKKSFKRSLTLIFESALFIFMVVYSVNAFHEKRYLISILSGIFAGISFIEILICIKKHSDNQKLFKVILQIVWFGLMLITSIYALYQKIYLEFILCGIFAILSFKEIPIRIKNYRES
ncbi:hypothetical protein [Haloimpatiens lingqiaonensis]|uniref:hypothetical protein n=1 Tax=Haloimpatiens lingqiaonensis TaxID=1380675 RepID=UPI0010FCDF71|nr:hypothetical protein [Haloimpatiens lingqiaonensis]